MRSIPRGFSPSRGAATESVHTGHAGNEGGHVDEAVKHHAQGLDQSLDRGPFRHETVDADPQSEKDVFSLGRTGRPQRSTRPGSIPALRTSWPGFPCRAWQGRTARSERPVSRPALPAPRRVSPPDGSLQYPGARSEMLASAMRKNVIIVRDDALPVLRVILARPRTRRSRRYSRPTGLFGHVLMPVKSTGYSTLPRP